MLEQHREMDAGAQVAFSHFRLFYLEPQPIGCCHHFQGYLPPQLKFFEHIHRQTQRCALLMHHVVFCFVLEGSHYVAPMAWNSICREG